MSTRRLTLLTVLLLIMVIGSGSLIHFQTKNLDKHRPRITQILKRITGYPVSIKKIKYSPFNGLFTLVIQELEILTQDPAEPPMLQAQETLVSLSPLSLLLGKPQLSGHHAH